jgi:hypothetical protein
MVAQKIYIFQNRTFLVEIRNKHGALVEKILRLSKDEAKSQAKKCPPDHVAIWKAEK